MCFGFLEHYLNFELIAAASANSVEMGATGSGGKGCHFPFWVPEKRKWVPISIIIIIIILIGAHSHLVAPTKNYENHTRR